MNKSTLVALTRNNDNVLDLATDNTNVMAKALAKTNVSSNSGSDIVRLSRSEAFNLNLVIEASGYYTWRKGVTLSEKRTLLLVDLIYSIQEVSLIWVGLLNRLECLVQDHRGW